MENKYKLIDFDIKKAKTPENPNGLEVVTKDGKSITIVATNFRNSLFPILAIAHDILGDTAVLYNNCGHVHHNYDGGTCPDEDLYLKEPIAQRRMTNRELSKWLRDKPKKYRECKDFSDAILSTYNYYESEADKPVNDSIMIRSNYGEWKEPLVVEDC